MASLTQPHQADGQPQGAPPGCPGREHGGPGRHRAVPATLSSVAAAAGVSTSTASRALSGHPSVLPSTRARVEAAASALGYQPNRTASALRTRRTGLRGLVVDNLRTATFHIVAEALQAWAADHDYQVLVCPTGGDPEREAAFLETVRAHHFDGVAIAGSG